MFKIGQEEIDAVAKVIQERDMFKVNGGLQESKKVETQLSQLFNCKYPIFLTSGYAALSSALVGMGIGPGDEVIVPAYTYIATAMVVVSVGAIPVLAEVDETLTIDPEDVKKKITPHTKAIIPVHIQGLPCNMDAIMEIAREHNLMVLEDACQADGGSYHGKRLGTIGDAGALSFNYFKIVSCGEGGAILTDNRKIFEAALIHQDSSGIAFFGEQMVDFSTEAFCGDEYRSNELCAAVLNVQLGRMDTTLAGLRKNKKYIMDGIKDLCKFAPSNDIEGDCGLVIPVLFDTEAEARKFADYEGVGGYLPIDTGRHVYTHWTPILEKRGAFHPLMDPFKMEANKDIIPDYHKDMCPQTLDILSRVVYYTINPGSKQESLDKKIAVLREALQQK